MDKKEVQERMESLQRGLAEVNQRLAKYAEEIEKLNMMKNATEGAISECRYWLDQAGKAAKESDTGKVKKMKN